MPAGKHKRGKSHARQKARRNALQALYQWQISGQNLADIESQFLIKDEMKHADVAYFRELLHGIPPLLQELDDQFSHYLDRPLDQVTPVELAILRIGTFELAHRPEIPLRVALNEAIELGKMFGADDSHKFVNGVLDKLAPSLRQYEHT